MKKVTGFTIIELMIVVVILGIIASTFYTALIRHGANTETTNTQGQTIEQCIPPNCQD